MKKILRYWLIYVLVESIVYIGLFYWLGFFSLLLIQIVSSACGIFMFRRIGGLFFRSFKGFLFMSPYLFESISFFLAAFLFIIPGIVTTILGLALFAPPARRYVEAKMKNKFKRRKVKNPPHFDM